MTTLEIFVMFFALIGALVSVLIVVPVLIAFIVGLFDDIEPDPWDNMTEEEQEKFMQEVEEELTKGNT